MTGYLRFPHIHNDLICFVAEDDVWLAPAGGGRAWRLSADSADVSHPRFSPDGSRVAWTGRRDGPHEVYVADADGGPGRRLSYWGSRTTRVCGWTPGGEILATTAAGTGFGEHTWAYAVPADDRPPRRLPFGPVAGIDLRPQRAGLLTGTWGRDPAFWKRYRGGTAGRLWLGIPPAAGQEQDADPDGPPPGPGQFRFTRIAAHLRSQLACPMLVGERIAFLSDHEGTGNVYSCALDGSDLRRHTDHDGFYARNAATDGRRIVYQCAGEIWLLDDLSAGAPHRVEVLLSSAAAGRAPRLISAQDHLGSLSADDSGLASAVEVRGTVHWLTHRDGPARALSVVAGTRARLPRVLGRTGEVAWVTDAEGADALEVAPATPDDGDDPRPRRLAAGALGWVSEIAAAPDGRAVAVASRDGHLRVVDIASGEVTDVTAAPKGPVTGLAWSRDSAWLAWSEPVSPQLRQIRMARAGRATGQAAAAPEVVDVTDGRFVDTDPAFTADGLYLAFLSRRSFDPVYDAHFFDLSFPFGSRPYLIPLAAATPSPFAPTRHGRGPAQSGQAGEQAGQAPHDADAAGGTGDAARGGERAEPAPVIVDPEGLAARVERVPVPEARYASLRAVQGGLAWLREPLAGTLGEGGADPLGDDQPRAALERFDLARRKVEELAEEVDWFEVSGDGSRLVTSDHGKLRVLPADRKRNPDNPEDEIEVDKSRARFLADPAALWANAYAEAGRMMRQDFWVEDMADVDWQAVLDGYRPLLDRVRAPSEFADVLWEIFGELGTSHAYVLPPGEQIGAESPSSGPGVGLLGADLEPGEDGAWRVARIVPGESSDPRARSPLATPGAQVDVGDLLVAVDGQPLDPACGPGRLLVGAAGKPVELTTRRDGRLRRSVVVALKDEQRLRYLDWVARTRQRVRAASDGRLGYLHVPDMVGQGWADFHRDLRTEMTRDGLIVDVRCNHGGHTSQLVVEKLARRIIGWDVPRNQEPESYPGDAPRGPVVALADEFAGSDGDIVTAAIRSLGLGPVVGTRTWGGVIGIDVPLHELVDGTSMSVPKYAFWFSDYGWGVENYGVDPDVEVIVSPEDWAAGRDPQLEEAIRIALARLAERPAAVPPDRSGRPSKRRPPLPGRSALLAGQVGRAAAEHVLLDLSGGGFRQLRDERHPVRGLKVGQPVPREGDQLVRRGGRAVAQHHERMRRLAPLLMRQPDDRHLLDSRMAQQHALDLDRGDVLAAADDHVLDPVPDLHITIRVHHGRVAAVEPAVAHHLRGRLGVAVVTLHHDVPPDDYLAEGLPVGRDLLPLGIHHPQLSRGEQLHALPCFDDRAVGRAQRLVLGQRRADGDERGRLRQPVDVGHLPAELALQPLDRGRRRGRPGGHHAHPGRDLAAHRGGRAGQRDQHRRRRAQPGHSLLADQPEHLGRVHLRQADVGARGRRHGPGVGPAIGMEHGQRPQVPLADADRQVQQRSDDVERGVAVRDHHALGPRRGTAGVVDREQVPLLDIGPGEGRVRGGDRGLVVDPPLMAAAVQRDEVTDAGQVAADGVDHVQVAGASADHAGAGVVQDEAVVVGGQPVVDRHQDRAERRHRVERL
jgi:tricorn protease